MIAWFYFSFITLGSSRQKIYLTLFICPHILLFSINQKPCYRWPPVLVPSPVWTRWSIQFPCVSQRQFSPCRRTWRSIPARLGHWNEASILNLCEWVRLSALEVWVERFIDHVRAICTNIHVSLCCVTGFQDLWGPWWGRHTKLNIWGAKEERKYSYCPGIQTQPQICSQTGGAGVCMCGSINFWPTFIRFIQCYLSVCVIPRSQTCPANSRKCNFTGSNSLRLCAVVKRHPQPALINAGTASPKPGIISKIFSFYKERCSFSWSERVIFSFILYIQSSYMLLKPK